MKMRSIRHPFAIGLLALSFVSVPALAQTDIERSGSREAGIEGVSLYNAGKYAEAVEKLTHAETLFHAPTLVLYLARSYGKLGKLVKARELYLKLKNETLDPKVPQAFVDAQKSGIDELEALDSRVPRLRVKSTGAAAEDVVWLLDGQVLPAELIDVTLPVDPGEHKLQLQSQKLESDLRTLTLVEGQRETVELSLTHPRRTKPAAMAQGSSPTSPPPPPPSVSRINSLRIGSYVALGVGAVGLGVGSYFLFRGRGKDTDAVALFDRYGCDNHQCTGSQIHAIEKLDDERDRAYRSSVVAYVVAGVAAATGATLFVLSSPRRTRGATASPYVGLNQVGVYGRF